MIQTAKKSPFRSMLSGISPSALLTFIYLSISILWILMSDKLANEIANQNPQVLKELQQTKGIFFVVLSGLLIYLISDSFLKRLKRSSKQYKGLEANYQVLNEATREGIFDCDLETMTAKLNKKMQFFLPGSVGSIEDFWETYKKRIASGDIKKLLKEYEDVVSSTRVSWQTEYRLLGEDNVYYNVLCSVYFIRNRDNKPIRFIGAIQDVSDLRNLQAEYYSEQINHKQKLATSIIEAQETEKNRWAEELHDNVCQLLSVAKLNLSAIDTMPESASILSEEAKKLVAESIQEIRQLSASLKPPTFEDSMLLESIQSLTEDIKRSQQIDFNIDTNELDEARLQDSHRLMIYRVVQEQLTNITKHAEASSVNIKLTGKGDHFSITVADNGKGFDTTRIKGGIGLKNIQSRLQVYKGKMSIAASPGNGSVLEARFSTKND